MFRPEHRSVASAVLVGALGLLLATYTLEPLRQAQWSIVDDHEIADFVGDSGHLLLREIPEKLRHTEVGRAGQSPRFRPSYYGLRLLETSLWGLDPAPWYRVRRVLYALSVLLVGSVLAGRIGLIATIGGLTWVLSGPYWFHVWGRLGPAETYAVFGAALWLYGIHLLWPVRAMRAPWRWLGLLALVVGSAIVVGAKETLMILAVPNAILAAVEARAGRTGGARWWACVIAVLLAFTVAAPLAIYFAKSGIDHYGRSVALGARVAVFMQGVRHLTLLHVAFALALVLWLDARTGGPIGTLGASPALRRLTSRLVLVSAGALGLFLTQFVFYNGDITPGTHYEFPASLASPALLISVAILLRRFLREVGAVRADRVVAGLTALALVGLALLSLEGFGVQRRLGAQWARATQDFTATITRAAAAARADPAVPVVVSSGRPRDVEPILSVGRFLRALGAPNVRFLMLDWESGRGQWNALDVYLAPSVERASRDGGLGYEPLTRLQPGAPCFSLGLGTAPRSTCRSLGRIS